MFGRREGRRPCDRRFCGLGRVLGGNGDNFLRFLPWWSKFDSRGYFFVIIAIQALLLRPLSISFFVWLIIVNFHIFQLLFFLRVGRFLLPISSMVRTCIEND